MYEVALDETWELFAEQLDGARSGLVLALSQRSLDERSRSALDGSSAALGYGACTFAAVEGLDGQALFLLVEGLDPLCLIAADREAVRALEGAFRCEVSLGKPSRVFGRTCVAFESFPAMLDDGQDKQVAWALLKKLPRFPAS